MTVGEWVPAAATALNRVEITSANLVAQLILAHVMGRDRSWVLAHPEAEIPELAANAMLERRLQNEPFAYLVGFREFYGRRFDINRNVLIPRQDTETLVEAVLRHHRLPAEAPLRLVDIGTGSGCIGITLSLERPEWEVTLTDLSPKALDVARMNAENLGAKVQFFEGDLFEPVQGERFDVIVSNPPYIATDEVLPQEVVIYEPEMALLAGPDGADIYRRIAATATEHLSPEGRIFLEIGYRQYSLVKSIFEQAGFKFEASYRDLEAHERVLGFRAV